MGVSRDPRFGPVAMVGIGGIYAEVLSDVQIGLAPLTAAQALAPARHGCAALRC